MTSPTSNLPFRLPTRPNSALTINDSNSNFSPTLNSPLSPTHLLTEAGLQRLNSLLAKHRTASLPFQHLAARSSVTSSYHTSTIKPKHSHPRSYQISRHNYPSSSNSGLNILSLGEQRHPGNESTRLGKLVETPDGSEYDDEDDMAGCGDMIESGFKERQDGNRRTRHGSKESLGTAASSAPIIKRNARHEKERIDSEIGTRWVQRQEKESLERDQESEKELEWQKHYPHGWALPFLVAGICAIVFLISLDRTIITTAIPTITAEFRSSDHIGWYGSAYFLTACAFQPLYGRIYQLFDIKCSFLVSILVFELGSLISAVSPGSIALIIGRSIAGLGSAGILTGSLVVIVNSVPLQQRPVYTATVGMIFSIGTIIGPLLGGIFTELASWHMCFYINLPIGLITILAVGLFFNPPSGPTPPDSILKRASKLDLIGNAIILGSAIMLFLALQYSETQYSWSSTRVTGLLAGSVITFVVFIAWQWWRAEWALVPPRIITQRSVAASCVVGFFINGALLIHSYFLPIYFQAVKGVSAIESGVDMIPYMAASVVFSLAAGAVVSRTGYYTPPAILGCALATVGCGLLSTLGVRSSTGTWVAYEILVSGGLGIAVQQGFTAVQTALPLEEVSIGIAAVVAFQSLGGSIFVSVGNAILQTKLLAGTEGQQVLGVDGKSVMDAGATGFRGFVTDSSLERLLVVYNGALQKVFLTTVPLVGFAMVGALCLEWRSVKSKSQSGEVAEKA